MHHVTNKTLLLFTAYFPYGTTETFLEPELPYLSRSFRKVKIIPMVGGALSRDLPDNVEVCSPFFESKQDQLTFFAKNLRHFYTWKIIFSQLKIMLFKDRVFRAGAFLRVINWGIYKSALERHPVVRAAVSAPDDYTAYSYWAHTPALAIPHLARVGIPCTVRYHSIDLYLHGSEDAPIMARTARYFPWRDEIASSADNVFISQHGIDYFTATWPDIAEVASMRVSRLGVCAPEQASRRANGNQVIAEKHSLTIVSCSQIIARKRVEHIARLCGAISKKMHVTWHHFGAGNLTPIKTLVALYDNLTFKPHGWVPNYEVLKFYECCDVDLFVNLSRREGIPVSIMEAMAHGIPVVATDVEGTKEAVISGLSGLLVSEQMAENIEALAKTILKELKPGGQISISDPRAVYETHFRSDQNFSDFARQLAS